MVETQKLSQFVIVSSKGRREEKNTDKWNKTEKEQNGKWKKGKKCLILQTAVIPACLNLSCFVVQAISPLKFPKDVPLEYP